MQPRPEITRKLAEVRRLYASGEATKIRLRAGISKAEFSRGAGVSAMTITSWEAQQRTPTGDRALRALALLQSLSPSSF